MTDVSHAKIPLPKFLKFFTSTNVPVSKAMALSAKLYKEYNTPSKLSQIDDFKLLTAGVDSKDDRKLIISALRESGYLPKDSRRSLKTADESDLKPSFSTPSTSNTSQASTSSPKRKRKQEDIDVFLPPDPQDEAASYGSMDFRETLDEEILRTKSVIINRAPFMTAWATLVAERLGFRREEALSIASVYTEMNAVTKGISFGVYESSKERGMEAIVGGNQPYIEFMGRRIPLYQTQHQQWRALSKGAPVSPNSAFSYICRSFRQVTPHVMGALKLLVDSVPVNEVNNIAWSLYAEFRPIVDKWGARSEVKCSTILGLRRADPEPSKALDAESLIRYTDKTSTQDHPDTSVSPHKRIKE